MCCADGVSFWCCSAVLTCAMPCCAVLCQAVRKMMDAKKLESTLNYDSDFKKSD
jgi:hypothetical protein